MSRTIIDLDDDLLAAAAQSLGTKTKRDTVNDALRQVTASQARQEELEQLRAGRLAGLSSLENIRDRSWRT